MLLTTFIEVVQDMLRYGGRWTLCLALIGACLLGGATFELALGDAYRVWLTLAAFLAGLYVGATLGYWLDQKRRS